MTRKMHPLVVRELVYGDLRGYIYVLIFLSPFHKAKNRVLATFSGSVARRGACSCSFKLPLGQVIILGE